MNILRNHLSSFNGQAVQGARDVVSSSFDLAIQAEEFNEIAELERRVNKTSKHHLKAFRKTRIEIFPG